MTPSRGTSRARIFSARNLARVVVAGVVVAGTPLVLSGTANAAPDEVWDQLAKCESGGKWNTSTGNGYSGGLQFASSTWRAHGGKGSPAGASREEQIRVAEKVLASQGWGAWPACSKKINAKGKANLRKAPSGQSPATKTTRTEVKPNQAPTNPVAPATPGTPGKKYKVAPGDTLSKIAKSNNKGDWQGVYERNKGSVQDPGKLKVGQELDLG